MFGAIAGGIASALAGGAMSKLFGGDRKSGSAGMPRPISYAVFCLKKKTNRRQLHQHSHREAVRPSARGGRLCALRAGAAHGALPSLAATQNADLVQTADAPW